ncbi:uncharacterized protein TNCV_106491 [Trichonephila clavipes]|nr:uncharacterized protein TNCV_106491 [Trichonephila clavipes]
MKLDGYLMSHHIQNLAYLQDLYYTFNSCRQLISKKAKTPLLFFVINMPRNQHNKFAFDLTHFGNMQIEVKGYCIWSINQCFRCNRFFYTAAHYHQKPRCVECEKEHLTKECEIKKKQDSPYCINCEAYGHTACYMKCQKFPKPRKCTPLTNGKEFKSNNVVEGFSFTDKVAGKKTQIISITPKENNKVKSQSEDLPFS